MTAHPSAEQLSAFLDQELPEAVRFEIEEHLGACDACAAHLAELASVDEAARALPVEAPAGYFDDFAARVRGRIVARPARRALPVWTFAAAAAVLLGVVTPLAWREHAARSPAPVAMKEQTAAPAAAVPAAPAVSAPKPQEAPAGGGGAGMDEAARGPAKGRRANELELDDRLLRRDQAQQSAAPPELQASHDKREALRQPEPVPTAAPAERLEEKAVVETKSFGYTSPPPATSQRPHGPYGQQQVAPPAAAAPAPADGEAAGAAETAVAGTADAFRDADLAKAKDDAPARRKRAESGGAAVPESKLGAAAGELRAEQPAATGDEARRKREAFRRMALERPEGAAADESRVGTIEQGVRAYRLEGRAEDRATAERDGRAYLARPDALQAPRVRALLKELEAKR